MYKFLVFKDGQVPQEWPLRNSHLLGVDANGVPGTIEFKEGAICVVKQEPGICALALQYKVGDLGEMTLQTTSLPARAEPYVLALELARHRLMCLYMRLEEWSMFDLGEEHVVNIRLKKARQLFMDALPMQVSNPVACQQLAQESLLNAIDGAEELTLYHAQLLLERRRLTQALPKYVLGCGVNLEQHDPRILGGLQANFETLHIPMPWQKLVPNEKEYHFHTTDPWIQWAMQAKRKLVVGPIIDFNKGQVPQWMYIWEQDYETVRDMIYDHIKQVVERYRHVVHVWNLFSGLNINEHFSFTYEQIVDLVRMGVLLVRKLAPKAQIMVEVQQPWGEYHGNSPRSLSPLRFCELLLQSSIPFDFIGLRLFMGQAMPGQYTRDLMQVSAIIDHFGNQGKPLHIVLAAPSSPVTVEMLNQLPYKGTQVISDDQCGFWRRPWSVGIQGRWLEACMHIAMSRPYVESVSCQDISDYPGMAVSLSGLVDSEMRPKNAFKHVIRFREYLRDQKIPVPTAPGIAPSAAIAGLVSSSAGKIDKVAPVA